MPAKDTKKSILVITFLPANFKEMVTCAERFPQEMIWLPQEIFFGVVTYVVNEKAWLLQWNLLPPATDQRKHNYAATVSTEQVPFPPLPPTKILPCVQGKSISGARARVFRIR